jgi:multicomponent Na+:H+ antiporter subunit D
MALGAALLGGLPFGLMDEGATAIDSAATAAHRDWVALVLLIGGATTGGAVLRASGRIFLGLGPKPGAEKDSPTVREQEAGNRPFWLMLAPVLLLLALALFPNALSEHRADEMAARFIRSGLQGIPGLDAADWLGRPPDPDPHPWLPWVTLGLAAMIAAYNFWRHRLPRFLNRALEVSSFPLFIALDRVHTGLIGDYVAWIAFGIALLAGGVAVF